MHCRRKRAAIPPTRKTGGGSTLFAPPPSFHGLPLSGSTALAFVCVRGHFRVLENEKFSTPWEGKPLPHPTPPTRSLRSLVCVPPTLLNMLSMPMPCGALKAMLCEIVILDTLSRPKLGYILSYEI